MDIKFDPDVYYYGIWYLAIIGKSAGRPSKADVLTVGWRHKKDKKIKCLKGRMFLFNTQREKYFSKQYKDIGTIDFMDRGREHTYRFEQAPEVIKTVYKDFIPLLCYGGEIWEKVVNPPDWIKPVWDELKEKTMREY